MKSLVLTVIALSVSPAFASTHICQSNPEAAKAQLLRAGFSLDATNEELSARMESIKSELDAHRNDVTRIKPETIREMKSLADRAEIMSSAMNRAGQEMRLTQARTNPELLLKETHELVFPAFDATSALFKMTALGIEAKRAGRELSQEQAAPYASRVRAMMGLSLSLPFRQMRMERRLNSLSPQEKTEFDRLLAEYNRHISLDSCIIAFDRYVR